MELSIVIVNYNVQYFIEQCLHSIFRSDFALKMEVFVVDNASSDDSIKMITTKFPYVKIIQNKENVGFSIANNQALRNAQGKYVLLLNPDTILEEDTLSICYKKMEENQEIGALGVRMLDGSGKYLPESKRGFPTPKAAFFKFSGLSKLFPKSSNINAYYQGHIHEKESAEIEILTGAFMFIRKAALDQSGLLDERFFMYGEDIDLSYRISQTGFKIFYFPETSIVHFKGESTNRRNKEYSQRFFKAMEIFAKKHFKGEKAKKYLKSISYAVKLKEILFNVRVVLEVLILPVIEFVLFIFGTLFISKIWAQFHFGEIDYYKTSPLTINIIFYSIIWSISIFYGGGYDKKYSFWKIVRNVALGTLFILAVYGLLNTEYRTSRALIIFSSIYVVIIIFLTRILKNFLNTGRFLPPGIIGKNVVIIGSELSADNINEVLNNSGKKFRTIIKVPLSISSFELKGLLRIHDLDEIICSLEDIGMKRIIQLMSEFGDRVDFKIAGSTSKGVIGSKSSKTSGEIYSLDINYAIQEVSQRRIKRTFDIISSFLLLVFSPILLLSGKKFDLLRQFFYSFSGKKSLVSYNQNDEEINELPKLKEGVIHIVSQNSPEQTHQENLDYARNYSVWKDVKVLKKFLVG